MNSSDKCKLIVSIPALLAPLLSIVTLSGKPLEPIAYSGLIVPDTFIG
jgi:hypothetical protein